MNVLFTHSYFYKFDSKQWRFKQPYPPLGTIQAAAVVRQEGFNVSLFDTNLLDDPSGLAAAVHHSNAKYLVIYDDGFNYLTKMCLTKMREAAFEMARQAKKLGCTVIVASSDSTDHYEKYLSQHVDYVIRGEGEETLKILLKAIEQRIELDSVAGIVFRKSGKTIINAARPVMKNLDELPLPAWDLVQIESYRKIWLKHHGYFSLNIATTRGCPFKCNWCAKPIYGNRYTSRTPQHVLKEIEYLKTHFSPDHFWMCDDIFGLKPGWVQEFKKVVHEKKLSFRYKIQSRVDLLLEEDTIEALGPTPV
jgi:anaerobic magnesium-protoporphyrin IX monomethyl ester cyclase